MCRLPCKWVHHDRGDGGGVRGTRGIAGAAVLVQLGSEVITRGCQPRWWGEVAVGGQWIEGGLRKEGGGDAGRGGATDSRVFRDGGKAANVTCSDGCVNGPGIHTVTLGCMQERVDGPLMRMG